MKKNRILKNDQFKTKIKYLIVLFIMVSGLLIYDHMGSARNLDKDEVYLTRCWDGDTAHFMIDGQDKKVRFLAIDAPEIAKDGNPADPYGDEAAEYTCQALENATSIHLEYEEEKQDKYNRVLAWIWIDGNLLQESIVEEGLAKVKYLYDDYRYTPLVQDAQNIAQEKHKGLWSK